MTVYLCGWEYFSCAFINEYMWITSLLSLSLSLSFVLVLIFISMHVYKYKTPYNHLYTHFCVESFLRVQLSLMILRIKFWQFTHTFHFWSLATPIFPIYLLSIFHAVYFIYFLLCLHVLVWSKLSTELNFTAVMLTRKYCLLEHFVVVMKCDDEIIYLRLFDKVKF